jgi:putative transposase
MHGVSTRKVDDLVTALGADSGIPRERGLPDLRRPGRRGCRVPRPVAVRAGFPYLFVDATYCKARVGGDRPGRGNRVTAPAIVVATGVNADGRREVLGPGCRTRSQGRVQTLMPWRSTA